MAQAAHRAPTATPDAPTALLDGAEALFARQGFAATTIKQIGAEAGVNPALIYYYFPDKARLYHAVLERRLGNFARRALTDLPPDLPPLQAVRRLLLGYAQMLRDAPHLPRLLARELADHEAAHALPIIKEVAAGVFRRLCDLIRAGQRGGEIRADLEPRFAAVSTIAQVAWFYVAAPAVSRLLGYEGSVPRKDKDRFAEHAAQFALAALTPGKSTRPTLRRHRVRQ
jgi:TetR/AcrR family transcriptional regulator